MMNYLLQTILFIQLLLPMSTTVLAQDDTEEEPPAFVCQICSCSYCTGDFPMGNVAGMILITQSIIDEFGTIDIPPSPVNPDPSSLEDTLALLGYSVGSNLPCALLKSVEGLIPEESCTDTLRLNEIVREECGCPALPDVEEEAVTDAPVVAPTDAPVVAPTDAPVVAPTEAPVVAPTDAPVVAPTDAPVVAPVVAPTDAPVVAPTDAPVAEAPMVAPTDAAGPPPVFTPTDAPVVAPSTEAPVVAPTTAAPVVTPVMTTTEAPAIVTGGTTDPPTEDKDLSSPLSGATAHSCIVACVSAMLVVMTVL